MDESRRRKIFIVIAVILFVIAIGVGLYFALRSAPGGVTEPQGSPSAPILFPGEQEVPQQGDDDLTDQKFPTIGQGGVYQGNAAYQKKRLTMLSQGPIIGYWIASSSLMGQATSSLLLDSLVFYLNAKGEVVQISDAGKEEVISSASLGVPLHVWQGRTGLYALVQFEEGFALFDAKNLSWEKLPDGTESAAFSPDGRKIAYLQDAQGAKDVYMKDIVPAKGKNPLSLIARIVVNDMHVHWISGNIIALMPSPSYDLAASPLLLDVRQHTVAPGPALRAIGIAPSGSSTMLMINSESKKIMNAALVSNDWSEIHRFPISTFEEKCSFSLDGPDVFCAVPRYFSSETYVLPDSYLKRDLKTKDVLYRLVAQDDFSMLPVIDAPQIAIDASNLTEVSNQLFFKNKFDDRLYVLDLRANEQ